MPRNGSGTFSRIYSWVTDAANKVNPSPSRFDTDTNDIGNEISNSIAADGQTQPTNNLPMATHRHTNVGAAVNRTDYLRADQAQDSTIQWGGTAAGTANAITIAPTPAITAYAAGQVFRFIASGTNAAGGTTIAISGLAAKNITQKGTLALGGGELKSGYIIEVTYDGTEFQLTGVFDPSIRTDVASAATLNLDTVPSNYANITGTTTITAITLSNGVRKDVVFAGVLTLTNGASLILPGGGNIVTAAGDTAVFIGEASGVVRCISYSKASGVAATLAISGANFIFPADTNENTAATVTIPAGIMGANGCLRITSWWNDVTGGSSSKTARIKFGGTTVATFTLGPGPARYHSTCYIQNANSTSAQNGFEDVSNTAGTVALDTGSSAIDTTANVSLTITGQKVTGSDGMQLNSYSVELLR